jgi:outer membrane receptor protein involved in Fe transport
MIKTKILLALGSVLVSLFNLAQTNGITVSGIVKDKLAKTTLSYAKAVLKKAVDSSFVTGSITDENGLFTFDNIATGSYFFEISYIGYNTIHQDLYIGSSSSFLNLGTIEMEESYIDLSEVEVTAKRDDISAKLDVKSYSVDDNMSQIGGSVLQVMQNLPGITVQDGKLQLRGSDKVTILIDGKQSALTGFGSQSGLDNIPASSIERIEIINNPSSKFDANGNAGIINIILKKEKKEGFNGKVSMVGGLGALWVRNENLPSIRPQYQMTPKINPSISLNYRKNRINLFFQADNLYTQTLNKNEFVTRTYDDGTIIQQQTKRNRNTDFLTTKAGIDFAINEANSFTFSALYGREKIIDHGDEPFFNSNLTSRLRLWQFVEDELKTTVMATASYQHKFKTPGHYYNAGFNYTFHRENEKYFFDNIMPTFTGEDAFKLISDEQVADFTFDYVRPLKFGRFESGAKYRYRGIPTNMQFYPGLNSPLDTNAGGWANYLENIPAVYANYIYENKKLEAEIGLRLEYVQLNYKVNPNHNTYQSDGYNYFQPFPTMRLSYKMNDKNRFSLFYNRRVDRPNEVDIRIFPKYDDAEIIKVGNPGLKPQFTNSFELAYKTVWGKGYFYSAAYHRITDGTITRISTTALGSNLIYAVFQNANRSYNSGIELVFSQKVAEWFSFNINMNVYHNQIDAFTITNKYPVETVFTANKQEIYSGNAKANLIFHFKNGFDLQLTSIYLAPDIIPQGEIGSRYSMDFGLKKSIQKGKGQVFLNGTDIFNTLVVKKEIRGNNFTYTSADYNETQVFRLGYSYKF